MNLTSHESKVICKYSTISYTQIYASSSIAQIWETDNQTRVNYTENRDKSPNKFDRLGRCNPKMDATQFQIETKMTIKFREKTVRLETSENAFPT